MRKLVAFVPALPEVVPVPFGVSFETTLLSRKMKERGVRPPLSAETSSGSSLTCRSVTLSCETGVSVWMTGAESAVTLTTSPTPPTSSLISTLRVICTPTRTSLSVAVLKPPASTVRRYGAAGSCGKVKLPSSLVFASAGVLVSVVVTVTFAPGTTAPLGSTTRPVIEPRSLWARAEAPSPEMRISSVAKVSLWNFMHASRYPVEHAMRLRYGSPDDACRGKGRRDGPEERLRVRRQPLTCDLNCKKNRVGTNRDRRQTRTES